MNPFRRIPRSLLLLICLSFPLVQCSGKRPPARERTAMQEAIDSYLGTPYQFGGTSHRGIDCSGLVWRVYQRVGVDLPRRAEDQLEHGAQVDLSELRFGDALFFRKISEKGREGILHVGLYMGEDRFVHASKARGVIVDSLKREHWQRLFLGARRYLE